MANTFIGADKLKKIFIGTTKVKKIYLDTLLVYAGTPTIVINGTTYAPTDEEIESGYQLIVDSDSTVSFNDWDGSSFKLTACVIGGGGAGGNGAYARDSTSWKYTGGAGGEGGETKIITPAITEGTQYEITIGTGATTISSNGSNTTAFGTTALGGHGAQSAGQWDGRKDGGSGTDGADGGKGSESYHGFATWYNTPTSGTDGTLFNGTYYAGGGCGVDCEDHKTSGVSHGLGTTYGAGGNGGLLGNDGAVILLINAI